MSVEGAGLDTAIFCDVIARFYVPNEPNGNQALAVGLALSRPMPPDPPMIGPVVRRTKDAGEPWYRRGITSVGDTSQAEAVLRNGVIFSAESVVLLSAAATSLARSLDLLGAREQYKQRVRRLVIVESAATGADPVGLRKVLAEFPAPMFYVGQDVGDALPFPGTTLDRAFAWTPAHPAADAYRAHRAMPYDAPLHDLAAMHFIVSPDAGFFTTADAGHLTVSDAGVMTFTAAPGGAVRRVVLDPAKRDQALADLVSVATSAPTPPPARSGRRGLGAA